MTDPPATDDAVDGAASRLAAAGEPYVVARVVRREPPVSATVGDRAVVTAEGEIHGWIGGVECAQTAVVEEAREALRTRTPRLVGLAPDPDDIARPGLVARPMTCHGGGTLEVFLEPVVGATDLLVVGSSPVADAVGRFAGDLGFAVTVVDPGGHEPDYATATVTAGDLEGIAEAVEGAPIAVVASMGEIDDVGVAAAFELGGPYIGLVANEGRASEVIERAAELSGVDVVELRSAVTVPAGVAIDAGTPMEIGVSVAAELVRVRNGLDATEDAIEEPVTARDPVCGMSVAVDDPAATVEHDGETYHFCSAGCADAFEAAPEDHLADA